jgi:hypothetical protein
MERSAVAGGIAEHPDVSVIGYSQGLYIIKQMLPVYV